MAFLKTAQPPPQFWSFQAAASLKALDVMTRANTSSPRTLRRLVGNHLSHTDSASEMTLAELTMVVIATAQPFPRHKKPVLSWNGISLGNSLREKRAGEIKITKYKLAADCVLFSLAHLAMSDWLLAAVMLRVTSFFHVSFGSKEERSLVEWVQRSLVECYLESAPQYTWQREKVSSRVNVDLGMEAKGFVGWGVVGLFPMVLMLSGVCTVMGH